MRETKIFNINGEDMELPLYREGDRVTILEGHTISVQRPKGTVETISSGGLIVCVKWDEPTEGNLTFGSRRLVNGLTFI